MYAVPPALIVACAAAGVLKVDLHAHGKVLALQKSEAIKDLGEACRGFGKDSKEGKREHPEET